jgi:hypothetical protein
MSLFSQQLCWLIFLILIFPSFAYSEKFFTWVDAQGHLQRTLIPDQKKADIKLEPPEKTNEQNLSNTTGANISVGKKPTPETSSSNSQHSPQRIQSEKTGKKAVQSNPYRQPIKESDYIDGEQLERQGFIRDSKHPPRYVWRDVDGTLRNSPYRPTPVIEKKPSLFQDSNGYTFSIETNSSTTPIVPPDKIDSFAKKLFFSNSKNDFQKSIFTSCCREIPKNQISTLVIGSPLAITINNELNKFNFFDGNSIFALIHLPLPKHPYALHLKSFINSSNPQNLEVFFPRLVFLNRYFKPLRMLSEPMLKYSPETWSSHAYLSGVFHVNPQHNEVYLLIYSSNKDLLRKSEIENQSRYHVEKIHHVKKGFVELIVNEE